MAPKLELNASASRPGSLSVIFMPAIGVVREMTPGRDVAMTFVVRFGRDVGGLEMSKLLLPSRLE